MSRTRCFALGERGKLRPYAASILMRWVIGPPRSAETGSHKTAREPGDAAAWVSVRRGGVDAARPLARLVAGLVSGTMARPIWQAAGIGAAVSDISRGEGAGKLGGEEGRLNPSGRRAPSGRGHWRAPGILRGSECPRSVAQTLGIHRAGEPRRRAEPAPRSAWIFATKPFAANPHRRPPRDR